MERTYWRGREVEATEETPDSFDPLGPDERDRDLLDGSWEPRRGRSAIRRYGGPAIAIFVLSSIVLGLVLSVVGPTR